MQRQSKEKLFRVACVKHDELMKEASNGLGILQYELEDNLQFSDILLK